MTTTTPTVWSGPITYYGDDDTRGAQIAPLQNGGFVLLYATGVSSTTGTPVGQYYGGTGTKIGGNFLEPASGLVTSEIDGEQMEDGALAFGFSARFSSSDIDPLVGRVAGPTGIVTRYYLARTGERETFESVTATPDGGGIVTWNTPTGVEFQRFNEDNTLEGTPRALLAPDADWSFWQSAGLKTGGVAVLYGNEFAGAYSLEYYVSFFSPSQILIGNVRIGPIDVYKNNTNMYTTKTGNVLVSYIDFNLNFSFTVYDANGLTIVPRHYLFLKNFESGAVQMTELEDGGYLIAWNSSKGFESGTDENQCVTIQRVDEEGELVGRNLVIDQPGDQTLIDMETLKDGRVLLTFQSETGVATNAFVQRFQIIDPRDAIIEGDERANGIYARLGDSELFGFEGADTLVGMAGDDTILGGSGADFLLGGDGDDSVRGGSGADSIDAGSGDDTLVGNGGADTLRGGLGADFMAGGGGNDVYVVDDLGDEVVERTNAGVDTVVSTISYTLGATLENLTLGGSAGLSGTGNALNNAITGNAGGNFLNGGLGRDTLDGGAGADRFIFSTALGAGNVDVISRYSVADDVIYLDNAVFLGLADGALAAGAFNTGSAATQTNDRVIYNASTGALLFDRDGLGGAAAIQFATIGVAVNAGEFLVI